MSLTLYLSLPSFQKELGDRLLPAFNTDSGIPYSYVNLATGKGQGPNWTPDSSVAEVGSIQLEFRDLSRITGDPKYQQAVDRAMDQLQSQVSGLVPPYVNPKTGLFTQGPLTIGARTDSYYEYLLKQWLQCGKKEDK